MFRVAKTTRRARRAASPIRPVNPVDLSGNIIVTAQQQIQSQQQIHQQQQQQLLQQQQQDTPFMKQAANFFDAESQAVINLKPWLRLERGIRLQKYRAFANAYPGLSEFERDLLYKLLVKANDAKLLNTKLQITYENGTIQSVKGLRMIRSGDLSEPAVFKIDIPRATKKHSENEST